jgi:Transposase DDE domain group 1
VKYSKSEIMSRAYKIPELKFEDQNLTSFAGLVIFQPLVLGLEIKNRLWPCFRHLNFSRIFGHHIITMLLIVHLLLGYRRLRDLSYYQDDPMVKRLLGLNQLPDASTVSRALSSIDGLSIERLRALCRNLVIERLKKMAIYRITLDFDGSVFSTQSRTTEGTAVGYNRKRKGARSYYPLFCTLAQTGQVFDVYHRPGNVHDSHGAREFIVACIQAFQQALPWVKIEVRMDSAFFSDAIVSMLDEMDVEFTVSVPFERFVELKKQIQERSRWRTLDATWSFFECAWKPKKWKKTYRFLFIRQRCAAIRKEPIQLDLFVPYEYGYEFKVIVTNKWASGKKVLMYHNGRAMQESVLGELKSQSQMDYIAVRGLLGNQLFMMAAILSHNLNRELQMATRVPDRGTSEKRTPLWFFEELRSLRHRLIQRAGRFTNPQGNLTLTLSANESVKTGLLEFLEAAKEPL